MKDVRGNAAVQVGARADVIRDDRIDLPEAEVKFESKVGTFEVVNVSAFGLAIRGPSGATSPGEELEGGITVEGVPVDRVTVRILRVASTSDQSSLYGAEVVGLPLSISKVVGAVEAVTTTAAPIIEERKRIDSSVPIELQGSVLRIADILGSISERSKSLENHPLDLTSLSAQTDVSDGRVLVLKGLLGRFLTPELVSLEKKLRDFDGPVIEATYVYFRQKLAPFFNKAPFSLRSLSKPLGYAGDYEMMNMIYRNELIGPDLLSRAIHKYMIEMPGGDAVRNRSAYFCNKISDVLAKNGDRQPRVRILSVASGPAFEIERYIASFEATDRSRSVPFDLFLLDQDQQSLKYAQRRLTESARRKNVDLNVTLLNTSIKRVVVDGLPVKDVDFIYSAGLFDYFSDSVSEAAAKRLLDATKSDGLVAIGNFDVSNPSRVFMEMAWDWRLIYRSRQDLERIFSKVSKNITVESEPSGVNLFCLIRK